MHRKGERDSLCCCEYVNAAGEHSHILAMCCDCQDLDLVCDRCMKCQPVPIQLIEQLLSVIEDRVRIPGLMGYGALKIKWDLVLLLLIPCGLVIATLGSIATTLIAIFYLIFLILSSYVCAIRAAKTKFFCRWMLLSTILLFYTFEILVLAYRKIAFWENLLLCSFVALTCVFCYQARNKRDFACRHQNKYTLGKQADAKCDSSKSLTSNLLNQTKNELSFHSSSSSNLLLSDNNESVQEQVICRNTDEQKTKILKAQIMNGSAMGWCDKCQLHMASNTEHCLQCDTCVLRRDHHSTWLNCCIGFGNKRSFTAALLCGFLSTLYGSILTVNTVCLPDMYFNWFLIPADCSIVYADFMSSFCWVSCLYSAALAIYFGVNFMAQCLLISRNLSWQEFQAARDQGTSLFTLIFSRFSIIGILHNWKSFLCN